jgi:hypothetical protein
MGLNMRVVESGKSGATTIMWPKSKRGEELVGTVCLP